MTKKTSTDIARILKQYPRSCPQGEGARGGVTLQCQDPSISIRAARARKA